MAEKDPLRKLEEQLQCAVCLDTYTDPKLLLCNHVYCQQCLELLVSRSTQEVQALTCPNCRKVTPIPEGGVKDLQPAFQINNLLEIRDSLEKKGVQAIRRITSFCPDHTDEELKLYCETCKKIVCFKCVIKGAEHNQCNYEMLNTLYSASLELTTRNLAAIESGIENLKRCRQDISNQEAVTEATIKTGIKQIHEALESRQTELITRLHLYTERKLESLASQIDQAEAMRGKLLQYHADIETKFKTSIEQEAVETKKMIARKMEEASSLFQPDILRSSVVPDVKFTVSADASVVCCNYSTRELLPDPTQCYATGPGLEAALAGEYSCEVSIFGVIHAEMPVQSLRGLLESEITGKNFKITI